MRLAFPPVACAVLVTRDDGWLAAIASGMPIDLEADITRSRHGDAQGVLNDPNSDGLPNGGEFPFRDDPR
jgi:hypothetical protein